VQNLCTYFLRKNYKRLPDLISTLEETAESQRNRKAALQEDCTILVLRLLPHVPLRSALSRNDNAWPAADSQLQQYSK